MNCELGDLKSRSAVGPIGGAQKLGTIGPDATPQIDVYLRGKVLTESQWNTPIKAVFRLRYEDVARNLYDTVLVYTTQPRANIPDERGDNIYLTLDETETPALSEKANNRRGFCL